MQKADEVFQARDLLFDKVPETDSTSIRIKHRRVEDVLPGMYAILLAMTTETNLTYLALNLNNLPRVESKTSTKSVICNQNKMQDAIGEMQSKEKTLKKERRLLTGFLIDHVRMGGSNAQSLSVEVQQVTKSPADTIASSLEVGDAQPIKTTVFLHFVCCF